MTVAIDKSTETVLPCEVQLLEQRPDSNGSMVKAVVVLDGKKLIEWTIYRRTAELCALEQKLMREAFKAQDPAAATARVRAGSLDGYIRLKEPLNGSNGAACVTAVKIGDSWFDIG